MRETLFRGKRKDTGEWIFGMPWIFKEKTMICPWHEGMCKYDTGYFPVEVISKTFGQFTGLLDKNDTKIFEGDIVVYRYGLNKEKTKYYEVFYDPEYGYWEPFGNSDNAYISNEIEVAGNIHDNPKLGKK